MSSFQDIYSSGYRLRKHGMLRRCTEHDRSSPVKHLCALGAGKVDLPGMRYILEVLHLRTMTVFPRVPYQVFQASVTHPAGTHCPLALDCSGFTTILLALSFGDRNLRDLSREPSIPLPHLVKASNFLKGVSEGSQPVSWKRPMGC